MGCNSSSCTEEANNSGKNIIENYVRENQETIVPNKMVKNDNKENKKEKKKEINKKKEEKDINFLKLNTKKKPSDVEMMRMYTDENKDALSNVLTEGVVTCDGNRLTMKKEHYNGVTLMKGIEECFSEDLNEDEIIQLVEDALGDHIIDLEGEQIPGTISSKQARAIADILFQKINKKNNDEDDKSGDIDLRNHPELKGLNIKIGVSELTRDVIKDIMFSGQKVDDRQIDLTYKNLTKDNESFKALSIQILP